MNRMLSCGPQQPVKQAGVHLYFRKGCHVAGRRGHCGQQGREGQALPRDRMESPGEPRPTEGGQVPAKSVKI